MTLPAKKGTESIGLVWIDCPYPVAAIGLARILETETSVHVGRQPPPKGHVPSSAILGVGSVEGLSEGVKRIREGSPDTLILVFSLFLGLPAARAALRAGARGYIHAGMQPDQIVRAVKVALKGQVAAPRQLLEHLIAGEHFTDFDDILSSRQREILKLVGDGLTNAQIAERLFLTEPTVKQRLRGAYKVLGVRNRTEAAKLVRNRR